MKNYDDIIHLPHHTSIIRPRMSRQDRAAQFSPFAALTGFGAVITETARLTDKKRMLSDDEKRVLDEKLAYLQKNLAQLPPLSVTYFLADQRKEGGAYEVATGQLKKIDGYARKLVFTDERAIPVDDITDITSPLFDGHEET